MSKFTELIAAMNAAPPGEKAQLLEYLMRNLERMPQSRLAAGDREALLAFAMEQVEDLLTRIPATPDYRTKDQLFVCEDYILGLVMYVWSQCRGAARRGPGQAPVPDRPGSDGPDPGEYHGKAL